MGFSLSPNPTAVPQRITYLNDDSLKIRAQAGEDLINPPTSDSIVDFAVFFLSEDAIPSPRGDCYMMHSSFDEQNWDLVRIFEMPETDANSLHVGFAAQSPTDKGNEVLFTQIRFVAAAHNKRGHNTSHCQKHKILPAIPGGFSATPEETFPASLRICCQGIRGTKGRRQRASISMRKDHITPVTGKETEVVTK